MDDAALLCLQLLHINSFNTYHDTNWFPKSLPHIDNVRWVPVTIPWCIRRLWVPVTIPWYMVMDGEMASSYGG
jgi:hypothetical protein